MTKGLTKRTLKGVAWLGGTSVARIGLKFVSVAILARLLAPADYGLVAGAFIAADLAIMLSELGLTTILVQRRDLRPDHVATALSVALVASVVFAPLAA